MKEYRTTKQILELRSPCRKVGPPSCIVPNHVPTRSNLLNTITFNCFDIRQVVTPKIRGFQVRLDYEGIDIKCITISPTVYSKAETLKVVNLCRNRNEAMVNRDVTPLIVPPNKSLYLKDGVSLFEHFADEVNTHPLFGGLILLIRC